MKTMKAKFVLVAGTALRKLAIERTRIRICKMQNTNEDVGIGQMSSKKLMQHEEQIYKTLTAIK